MAEPARAAVHDMAVARAENITRHKVTQNMGPKIGRPLMKHPTFIWEAEDKYN